MYIGEENIKLLGLCMVYVDVDSGYSLVTRTGNIFAITLRGGRQTINRASRKCEGKGSSNQKQWRLEVVS